MKKVCLALVMVVAMAGSAWGTSSPETIVTDIAVNINKHDLTDVGYAKNSYFICFDMKTTIPDGMRVIVSLENGVNISELASAADGGLLYVKNNKISGCFNSLLDRGLEAGEYEFVERMSFTEESAKHPGYALLNGRLIGKDDNDRKTFEQRAIVKLPAVPKAEKIKSDDDDESFAHDMITITVKDDDANAKAMRETLKELQKRIDKPQVLGNAAGKVSIERKSSVFLCDHIYTTKDYPQLQNYKEDVSELYTALRTIKRSEEFSKMGLHAPNAKKWQALCNKLAKKYENIKLPYGYADAFSDLRSLAVDFSTARLAPPKDAHWKNSLEETMFITRKRIEATTEMMLDD